MGKAYLTLWSGAGVLAWALALGAASSAAAPPTGPISADLVAAKAYVQDLLARRYERALSTILDKDAFTVSPEVDLAEVAEANPLPPGEKPANGPLMPYDFTLGRMPLQSLLSRQAADASREEPRRGPRYLIRGILFSVGLSHELPAGTQGKVNTFMNRQLASEFGKLARQETYQIQSKLPKPEPSAAAPKPEREKSWLDRLSDFQILVGLLVMGLLTLAGLSAHRGSAQAADSSAGAGAGSSAAAPALGAEPLDAARAKDAQAAAEISAEAAATSFAAKIRELAQNPFGLDALISIWSARGEAGCLRIALFLDATAGVARELRIPETLHERIGDALGRLPSLDPGARAQEMERVYLDLLTCRALGPTVLERPFSYLGQLPDGSVQGILQEQDPAQRATIALHLPAAIRLKYLQSVDVAGKQFLFEEILKLEAVRLADLRALDQSVKARVRQEAGQEAADAPTLPLVQDFLSTLTADEEIQLLKSAKSAARLRPHYASPAFLDTWTDDSLKLAFADENPFVAAAYLGCFPEMRARIEAAMPPISLIILTDEMTTLENRPAADRQAALETLRKRVRDLVKTGQVGLIALDLTPMSETAQREAA